MCCIQVGNNNHFSTSQNIIKNSIWTIHEKEIDFFLGFNAVD